MHSSLTQRWSHHLFLNNFCRRIELSEFRIFADPVLPQWFALNSFLFPWWSLNFRHWFVHLQMVTNDIVQTAIGFPTLFPVIFDHSFSPVLSMLISTTTSPVMGSKSRRALLLIASPSFSFSNWELFLSRIVRGNWAICHRHPLRFAPDKSQVLRKLFLTTGLAK